MKLHINHQILKKALNIAYRIPYEGSGNIKTNSFFIEVNKNKIIIRGKNEYLAIQTEINTKEGVEIKETGKFVVNSLIFNELIQKTNGEIIIENTEDSLIVVKSKKYRTEINCLPLDLWNWNEEELSITKLKNFTLKTENFNKILRQTGHCVQIKEGSEIFKGINFKTANNKLFANTTDGSRIANKEIMEIDKNFQFVLPLTGLNEINRINSIEKNSEVQIFIDEKKAIFKIGENTKIRLKLIEGKFPDAKQQIDSTLKCIQTSVICERKILIEAIEKASLFFEKNAIPVIVFKMDSKKFLVSCLQNEVGYFEEKILNSEIEGEKQKINLQAKFVLSVLKSISEEKVLIRFSENEGPVLFTGLKDKQTNWLILPFWLY